MSKYGCKVCDRMISTGNNLVNEAEVVDEQIRALPFWATRRRAALRAVHARMLRDAEMLGRVMLAAQTDVIAELDRKIQTTEGRG